MKRVAANDSDYMTPNELFEYRANLAKTDPERLERELNAEVEKVISQAPAKRQQGLRQLQWRIDMERRRAKNPTDAMVRLQRMMWRQFYAENGFVFAVKQLVKVCHMTEELIKESSVPDSRNAEILPFKSD